MIRVTLDRAGVGAGETAALPPVNTTFSGGSARLLATEGGTRPTVLSLVASGRMRVDTGTVTAVRLGPDGSPQQLTPSQLRRAIALIDTPLVAEHSDDVSIHTVVREELALAGSTRGRKLPLPATVNSRKRPFGSLEAVERLGLLIDLALRRPDVEALVITSPERHGGEPALWWRLVRETAARGVAVLVVTDHATVEHLRRVPDAHPGSLDDIPLFSL